MTYIILYEQTRLPETVRNSLDLVNRLKDLSREQIEDIRKVYVSGITDSVLEKYEKYLK